MNRDDYLKMVTHFSTWYLLEKKYGLWPQDGGWAEWCHARGVYPLTNWEDVHPPR